MLRKQQLKNDIAKIYLREILNENIAPFSGLGDIVFREICRYIDEDKKVCISFLGMDLVTSTFLNHAIGQLYGKYPESKIKDLLSVEDAEKDDLYLIKKVVDNAKEYFKRQKTKENFK